jgi:hypothetical protein
MTYPPAGVGAGGPASFKMRAVRHRILRAAPVSASFKMHVGLHAFCEPLTVSASFKML